MKKYLIGSILLGRPVSSSMYKATLSTTNNDGSSTVRCHHNGPIQEGQQQQMSTAVLLSSSCVQHDNGSGGNNIIASPLSQQQSLRLFHTTNKKLSHDGGGGSFPPPPPTAKTQQSSNKPLPQTFLGTPPRSRGSGGGGFGGNFPRNLPPPPTTRKNSFDGRIIPPAPQRTIPELPTFDDDEDDEGKGSFRRKLHASFPPAPQPGSYRAGFHSKKEVRRERERNATNAKLAVFERIDEFDVDPASNDQLQKYLRRRGQQAEMEFLHDQSGHFAQISFQIGSIIVKAMGNARNKKNAQHLCAMHAVRLMDYYTEAAAQHQKEEQQGSLDAVSESHEGDFDTASNDGLHYSAVKESSSEISNQPQGDDQQTQNLKKKEQPEGESIEEALAKQRRALILRAPKPLRLGEKGEHDKVEAKPYPPRIPNQTLANAAELDAEGWETYLAQCREYLSLLTAYEKKENLRRLMVPPTGDPLVDQAAQATQMASMNYSALSRLQSVCRLGGYDLPEEWTVATVAQGVKVCTLGIPQFPFLQAVGLGKSAQDAKVRCAMHALQIIKLAETVYGEVSKKGSNRRFERRIVSPQTSRNEVFSAPQGGDGAANTVVKTRHSDEVKSRLIELYCVCLNLGVPQTTTEFCRHTSVYTSTLTIGEMTCSGRGIHKIESERLAYHSIYEELTQNDELFRDIIQLLETHPHLDPEHIVKLELSEKLNEEISDLVKNVDLDKLESVHLDRNVDKTTRHLLDRISNLETNMTVEERNEHKKQQVLALKENDVFKTKFEEKKNRLAITAHREELLKLVEENRTVIVCGTTGCGKTTQVPQMLLEHEIAKGKGSECSIIVTQPRRISAVSISARIAAERLEEVGQTVGYTIRLESKPGSNINLCTTGVLLQLFLGNPDLNSVKYLIIDEIHDRDLNCDFALVMVKELLARNSHIRVLLMSATLQSELFSSYFNQAPVLMVDGQLFPVEEKYLDEIAMLARKRHISSFMFSSPDELPAKERNKAILKSPKNFDYHLLPVVITHVVKTMDLTGKSVLVFLPGWKEIVAAKRALESNDRYHFILLHSSVEQKEQMQVFQPAPEGKYKIILSTNIAESGVTIDDVAVVLDAGTIKEMSFLLRSGTTNVGKDSYLGLNQLVTAYAARANCIQRKGRAGRTQGGVCYRFYTKEHFESLPSFQTAEMLRQPLDSIILRILAMGYTDPKGLLEKAIEPPDEKMVASSLERLKNLGAIDFEHKLTSLGQWLSKLPTEPHVGKMIMLGAVLKCLDSVLTLAAANEIEPFIQSRDLRQEIRERKFEFAEDSCSDQIGNVNAFNGFSASSANFNYTHMNYLSFNALNILSKYKKQFFDILVASGFLEKRLLLDTLLRRGIRNERGHPIPFVEVSEYSKDALDIGLVKSVICAGLFPNVALQNTMQKGNKEKVLRTKLQNHLVIGKSSVAYKSKVNTQLSLCPYYVYEDVILIADSHTEFLSNVTNANMWSILLLGASPNHVQYRDDLCLGVVDDWIMFCSSADTVENILKLKKLMHYCIWNKFNCPEDVENNLKLERIQKICKELVNMPMKPNELAGREWKQCGKIISPLPISFPGEVSNVDRMNKALRRSTVSLPASGEQSIQEEGDEEGLNTSGSSMMGGKTTPETPKVIGAHRSGTNRFEFVREEYENFGEASPAREAIHEAATKPIFKPKVIGRRSPTTASLLQEEGISDIPPVLGE